MREYNEFNLLTKNYCLTDFSKVKKKENYNQYLLVSDVLESYGINMFGAFEVSPDFKVYGVNIHKGFNPINFEIIRQFYGYENITVDIGLMGFTPNNDRSICFIEYNTSKDSIVLKELSFGSECFRKEYDSFKSLWEEVCKHEFIDDLKSLTV